MKLYRLFSLAIATLFVSTVLFSSESQAQTKLRIQSGFPPSSLIYLNSLYFAKQVNAMSGGRLIVEILQPFHGRIFDPACGSGGMFVQSAAFVQRHQKNATRELTVFGTEKASDTVKLAKMNLAVHGLSGDVREANTYYEDPHKVVGRFDFTMANPPFNQSEVDKARLVNDADVVDARFALGVQLIEGHGDPLDIAEGLCRVAEAALQAGAGAATAGGAKMLYLAS